MRQRHQSPVLDSVVGHAEMDASHVVGENGHEQPNGGHCDGQLEDDGHRVVLVDVTLCVIQTVVM